MMVDVPQPEKRHGNTDGILALVLLALLGVCVYHFAPPLLDKLAERTLYLCEGVYDDEDVARLVERSLTTKMTADGLKTLWGTFGLQVPQEDLNGLAQDWLLHVRLFLKGRQHCPSRALAAWKTRCTNGEFLYLCDECFVTQQRQLAQIVLDPEKPLDYSGWQRL